MITKYEFESAITKLVSSFGDKHFSEDRVKRIYEIVKNLKSQDFNKMITHVMDNSRSAPIPSDFTKMIYDLRLAVKTSPSESFRSNSAHRGVAPWHIKGDWWLVTIVHGEQIVEYVTKRAKSVSECVYIIKKDNPDHPMAILADKKKKDNDFVFDVPKKDPPEGFKRLTF